ncbi:MAG: FkbM family methyltransferase [Pseudomonadales bacterium]|nr:FkbM family methyltransferase [Candidatus Woesebacteria bacterium]MCB9801131.1 FkbM family methyltransferase [Pseudomonadales bacterium]
MQSAKLKNFTVYFENSEEYHHLKREVFSHDEYYFETDNPNPVIIDAGAHIGLTTLYFKSLYPHATIIALEPNPDLFKLLEKNIWENQLENVTTIQGALSDTRSTTEFFVDSTKNQWWSTGSFIKGAWTKQQESQAIQVDTWPLSEFVTQPIDVLKLDIEGAEQAVLEASQDALPLIDQILMEYHSVKQQNLYYLSEILKQQGYTLSYAQDGKELTKFNIKQSKGLISVHAWRQ